MSSFKKIARFVLCAVARSDIYAPQCVQKKRILTLCILAPYRLRRDETRAQFADFGGGAALADSVREFRGIASVQKHAMAAAANAMVDGRNRESFARNGGLEATVAGVNALPGDASVAKAGCGVLRNMADGSNGVRDGVVTCTLMRGYLHTRIRLRGQCNILAMRCRSLHIADAPRSEALWRDVFCN